MSVRSMDVLGNIPPEPKHSVTNVGEFKCHMCLTRDPSTLGPATIKIGALMQVSVYLCIGCQHDLKKAVSRHISEAPASDGRGPGRNIIV